MDEYIEKIVKVSLPHGIYYKGRCIKQDENMITILDLRGNLVLINLLQITALEVVA